MPRSALVSSIAIYGLATLVAAAIAAFARVPSIFSPPKDAFTGAVSIAVALAFVAAVVGGGRLLERYRWYSAMADRLRPVVRVILGRGAGTPEALALAAASALGEESLFRGALQPGLIALLERHLIADPTLASAAGVALVSVSFTLCHPPLYKELRPWTIFALVFGLVLGTLAAWSGSLAAPVLAHFLVNFLNLRRLLATPDPVAPPPARC
jgi:membrane protease YdiL (CAAX protease family)